MAEEGDRENREEQEKEQTNDANRSAKILCLIFFFVLLYGKMIW